MSTTRSLLKFQIGPVQDFIAAARSTRDLWSGSYLLSWLVAVGIRELQKEGGKMIFPNPAGQPLLDLDKAKSGDDHTRLLIPNFPNLFIARVEGDVDDVASKVERAIETEWKKIANAVWLAGQYFGLTENKDRFDAQVKRHLSIAWQATPLQSDYEDAYRHNGWHLDAVRQTRDFKAWDSGPGMNEKDSLSGREEALFTGSGKPDQSNDWHKLFNKHTDHLGAVAIIKRCWHLAYLKAKWGFETGPDKFRIRSIPAIAARQMKHDDDEDAQEKVTGDKYIAAIAFDGDSIGRWVNGDFHPNKEKLAQHHSDFSKALSNFALHEVREKIVEAEVDGTNEKGRPAKVPLGQLIYAGGDDVVCLVPADAALEIAEKLRTSFCKCTEETPSEKGKPDASAGIAIAHIHAPLQDLIREAQKAEKRAKKTVDRSAFSVTLMKRSGEISHWGSKWKSKGLELYRAIAGHLETGGLSAKFPHRVCELLTPYLTQSTGLSTQANGIEDVDMAKDLIAREFAFAAVRQGSKDLAIQIQLKKPLDDYLDGILAARSEREGDGKPSSLTTTQELLTSLIDLCITLAFADRTKPAEKQEPS
ncbi:type III-B CRISPR-associated protein Cas10/Cmr2 [Akkermansiaceae bacterium]|nr:type III-B CRISPR-associated protein Cas10/Cmr2 [Akkermansiaceae bacterium]